MKSLYQYEKEQDALCARDEAIEDKTQEVLSAILEQHIVMVAGDKYHMDDFIADVDINTDAFIWSLKGAPEDFNDIMNDKLSEWCKEIATKLVDKGE